MRILILSDTHTRRLFEVVAIEDLRNVDFAITVGDIDFYEDFLQEGIKVIGVLGNHDMVEKFNKEKILVDCHKQIRTFYGYSFFGIEGVFCGEKRWLNRNRRRWYHQLESDVAKVLEETPKVNFFLTHYRAKGIFDRFKEGSPSFRKYIEEKQPDFYISGHTLHEDKVVTIGKTICINPHGEDWSYVILTLPSKHIEFKGEKSEKKRSEDKRGIP